MNRVPRFLPWLSPEEVELMEEASRRTGKVPTQFIKEAGLAIALAVLDETDKKAKKSRIQCISDIRWKHCIDCFR